MAQRNKTKASPSSTAIQKALAVAAVDGIHTEDQVDAAISAVFLKLTSGSEADHEQIKLMLSAINKKLHMESLKVRAGFYKSGANGFFTRPQLKE